MWDALFVGVGTLRRDEGIAAVIAKVVFRFVVNLTMGLFMAVIGFLFSIWQVGCGTASWYLYGELVFLRGCTAEGMERKCLCSEGLGYSFNIIGSFCDMFSMCRRFAIRFLDILEVAI